MTHRTIFAFCPEHYRPDYEYLFVAVAAEFVPAVRMWTRVGNLAVQFPPEGAVFVPRALLPEPFRPGDPAAWVVQDQPDYQHQGLSTRYRAIRTYHCPFEVVAVPRASDDLAGVQQVLRQEGLTNLGGPEGREVLLEFSDGWIAGPVPLEEKPNGPRTFLCAASALARPLPAWKSRTALQLLRLDWEGRPHFFACTEALPPPHDYLDFASLEEALRSALLIGGLRGGAAPVAVDLETLTAFLQQVRTALPGGQFQARRRRLEKLLEEAQHVAADRAVWEQHLIEHPLFKQLVNGAIDRMRDELMTEARRRVLEEENILRERIRQLEHEETAHRQTLERLHGFRAQAAAAVEILRQARESLAALPAATDGRRPRPEAATPEWEPVTREGGRAETVAVLATPAAAVEHLARNLERLGLRAESAVPLAREVFAAASLGQLLLFSGSMAVPVAEAVACSLAAERLFRLSAAEDRTPLTLPETDPEETSALLLEDVNRMDLAACGPDLMRMLRERVLGLGAWPPVPLLLATVGDNPPPGAALLSFGPLFQTDCLSWDGPTAVQPPLPGDCTATAWDLSLGEMDVTPLLELVEAAVPQPYHLWERNLRTVARRLAGLPEAGDDQERTAGLLFGWLLPWLVVHGCGVPQELRGRCGEAVDAPRVARLLRSMAGRRVPQ